MFFPVSKAGSYPSFRITSRRGMSLSLLNTEACSLLKSAMALERALFWPSISAIFFAFSFFMPSTCRAASSRSASICFACSSFCVSICCKSFSRSCWRPRLFRRIAAFKISMSRCFWSIWEALATIGARSLANSSRKRACSRWMKAFGFAKSSGVGVRGNECLSLLKKLQSGANDPFKRDSCVPARLNLERFYTVLHEIKGRFVAADDDFIVFTAAQISVGWLSFAQVMFACATNFFRRMERFKAKDAAICGLG